MTRYVPPSPDNVVSFGSGRGLRGANVQLQGPLPKVVEPMHRVLDSVDFRRPLLTKRERFLLGVGLILSVVALLSGCGLGVERPGQRVGRETPSLPADASPLLAAAEAVTEEHCRPWAFVCTDDGARCRCVPTPLGVYRVGRKP
jgi:hypothetical protein